MMGPVHHDAWLVQPAQCQRLTPFLVALCDMMEGEEGEAGLRDDDLV